MTDIKDLLPLLSEIMGVPVGNLVCTLKQANAADELQERPSTLYVAVNLRKRLFKNNTGLVGVDGSVMLFATEDQGYVQAVITNATHYNTWTKKELILHDVIFRSGTNDVYGLYWRITCL